MLSTAMKLQPLCGMQQAYAQNMDLSKAWLKDPRKAAATLQGLSIEVSRCFSLLAGAKPIRVSSLQQESQGLVLNPICNCICSQGLAVGMQQGSAM